MLKMWASSIIFRQSAVSAIFWVVLSSLPCQSWAGSTTPDGELHVRLGMVDGTFTGSGASGSFSVINSVDFAYEFLQGTKYSLLVRTTISYSVPNAGISYAYTGIGMRYYLFTNGRGYDQYQSGLRVQKIPRWRLYLGPDVGMSEVVVKSYGGILATPSALIEFGGSLGGIYSLSSKVGIEAELGYSFGTGISTVLVGATVLKGLLGMSFYF